MATQQGTTIYYGDTGGPSVILKNVLTTDWAESVEYDPSNADAIRTRITATFEGILHEQNVTTAPAALLLGSSSSASSIAERMAIARKVLSTPRLNLEVKVGPEGESHTILNVYGYKVTPGGTTEYLDLANGPHPRKLSIVSIVGNQVYRIQWEVECVISTQCTKYEGGLLNHRWSVRESMDDNQRKSRFIKGTMITSSHVSPDQYRLLAYPGLEIGFRRKEFSFEITPDGLSASYSVVDEQVDTAAPWPATNCRIQHTVAIESESRYLEGVTVQLYGPPQCSRVNLIARAVQIADNRLNFIKDLSLPASAGSQANEGRPLVEEFSISDVFGTSPDSPSVVLEVKLHRPIGIDGVVKSWAKQREPKEGSQSHPTLGMPLKLSALKDVVLDEVDGTEYDNLRSVLAPAFGWKIGGTVPNAGSVISYLFRVLQQSPCQADLTKGFGSGAYPKTVSPDDSKEEPAEKPESSSTTGTSTNQVQTTGTVTEQISKLETTSSATVNSAVNYNYYRMELRYATHNVAFLLPLADGTGKASYIDGGARATTLDLFVEAESQDRYPELPSLEDGEEIKLGSSDGTDILGYILGQSFTVLPPYADKSGGSTSNRLFSHYRIGLTVTPKKANSVLLLGIRSILKPESEERITRKIETSTIFSKDLFPGS